MNETEYQTEVRQLWTEMQQRADTAVDYLVSQPPIRMARQELYALLEWALIAGAENEPVIRERIRRRELASKLPSRQHVRQAHKPGQQVQDDHD